MRLHAIATFAGASVVAMAMSCGETLPATADASDAAVDATLEATADAAVDADADVDAGCTSAPCNVEEVATAQPAAIAASGAAMVWLENARVFLLDPGKAPITLMTPPNGTTGFLAIDNVTVLMTEDTGIRRCPTTGGCNAADPSVPIYQLTDTGPIAAGGGEMFATERTGARRLVSCGIDLKCDVSPGSSRAGSISSAMSHRASSRICPTSRRSSR